MPKTIERLREEAATVIAKFSVFDRDIRAHGDRRGARQVNAWPSFSQKWKDGTAAMLEDLVAEVEEAVHGS